MCDDYELDRIQQLEQAIKDALNVLEPKLSGTVMPPRVREAVNILRKVVPSVSQGDAK